MFQWHRNTQITHIPKKVAYVINDLSDNYT